MWLEARGSPAMFRSGAVWCAFLFCLSNQGLQAVACPFSTPSPHPCRGVRGGRGKMHRFSRGKWPPFPAGNGPISRGKSCRNFGAGLPGGPVPPPLPPPLFGSGQGGRPRMQRFFRGNEAAFPRETAQKLCPGYFVACWPFVAPREVHLMSTLLLLVGRGGGGQ